VTSGSFFDRAECSAVEINVWKADVCAVEDVDDFSAMYGTVLRHFHHLIERAVDAMQIRTDDYVAARVSKYTSIRVCKCRFIEQE
jgi:hypothetical protein